MLAATSAPGQSMSPPEDFCALVCLCVAATVLSVLAPMCTGSGIQSAQLSTDPYNQGASSFPAKSNAEASVTHSCSEHVVSHHALLRLRDLQHTRVHGWSRMHRAYSHDVVCTMFGLIHGWPPRRKHGWLSSIWVHVKGYVEVIGVVHVHAK